MKKLVESIVGVGQGMKVPVMDLTRENPATAAVLSKLITSNIAPTYDQRGNRSSETPDMQRMNQTSDELTRDIVDADTVMQVLPDTELSAQILISSVLSPKDMITTELTFQPPEGLLPPEVGSAVINVIRMHFDKDYKIKSMLYNILRDVLFRTGSYPVAVIPENAIDDLINSGRRISMESLSDTFDAQGQIRSLGILGPVVKESPKVHSTKSNIATEMFSFQKVAGVDPSLSLAAEFGNMAQETYTTVTDNFALLNMPILQKRVREQQIVSALGSRAMEAAGIASYDTTGTVAGQTNLTDRQLAHKLYKSRNSAYVPVASIKTQDQLSRRTVGNPLVLHLPSEAVIPVYVPGTPEQHVGYFVMLDEEGNPLAKSDNPDYYRQLENRLNSGGSFPSAMLQKVRTNMTGFNTANREHLNFAARTYGSMVERELMSRLRNGLIGGSVAVGKNEDVYRIMLARALSQQHTHMLFLPAELMTYFAFNHTNEGIGKSLLDDMKILNSLRAMMLFANVMAGIKNSIGRTEVKLKFDEHDPDPRKTSEIMMDEIVRTRQQGFPVGTLSPGDITGYLGRAGLEFTFEGHPGMPDVQVDFGEKSSNYVKPDTDLEDDLRKRAIMGFGLSPETVDATFQAEFATSVVTNNILLSKRAIQIQEKFTPFLNDHLRKYAMNSESLVNAVRSVLKENISKIIRKYEKEAEVTSATGGQTLMAQDLSNEDLVVQQTLNSLLLGFEVQLPQPNSVTLENQVTALETYTTALDKALDAYISSNIINSDTAGDVSAYVDTLKETVKAHYIRRWMSENGMLTELAELVTTDDEGKPMIDIYKAETDHINALKKSLSAFMDRLQEVSNAANLVEADRKENSTSQGGGTSAPSGDTGSTEGGDSDPFGMGGSDDPFGSDTPVEGETEAEPGAEETPPADDAPAEAETPPAEQEEKGDTQTEEDKPE